MGNANRISVLVLVAVSIIWIPVINSMASSRLFDYMQLVQNLIAPPVTAVFLMAVLWPRTNEQVSQNRLKVTDLILGTRDRSTSYQPLQIQLYLKSSLNSAGHIRMTETVFVTSKVGTGLLLFIVLH